MTDQHNGDNDTIMNRMKKLLALTVNPNPNEAANAAAKVQEMLITHNIEMAELENWMNRDEIKEIGVTEVRYEYSGRNHPLKRWKESLASTLSHFNHVRLLYHGNSHFIFIGEATQIQAMVLMYEWIKTQLEIGASRDWPIYKESCRVNHYIREDPLVYRNSYFMGAVQVIWDRLSEIRRDAEKSHAETMTAIVLVHDTAIGAYMEDKYSNLKEQKVKHSKNWSRSAIEMGKKTGREVGLGTEG